MMLFMNIINKILLMNINMLLLMNICITAKFAVNLLSGQCSFFYSGTNFLTSLGPQLRVNSGQIFVFSHLSELLKHESAWARVVPEAVG